MTKVIKLKNGIPLILEHMPNVKSFTFGICCRVGSKDESYDNEGISHFLEHILFRGTKTRSSYEISESIDNVGGEINAFTSRENTVFYSTVLSKNAEMCVDVLSDLVLNPAFNEVELEKERAIILEEVMIHENSFDDLVHEINLQNVYRDSSLGLSILGRLATIMKIGKEDLESYYRKFYIPNNLSLSIAGNFDENLIIDKIEEMWSSLERIEAIKNNLDFNIAHNSQIVPKNTGQVHVCVNATGSSYSNDDYYILQLISNILGSGTSSRLYKEIREDKGLAYSVYSYISAFDNTGLFTSYIGTIKNNYERVIDLTLQEYIKLNNELISEKEFDKSKNQIIASVMFDIENTRTEMFRNMNDYFSHGLVATVDEVENKISSITREDILEFARKNFNEKNRSFIALGDVA